MASPLYWGYKVTLTETQMKLLDEALLLAEAQMTDARKRGSHPLGWSVAQQRLYEVARKKFGQEARKNRHQ